MARLYLKYNIVNIDEIYWSLLYVTSSLLQMKRWGKCVLKLRRLAVHLFDVDVLLDLARLLFVRGRLHLHLVVEARLNQPPTRRRIYQRLELGRGECVNMSSPRRHQNHHLTSRQRRQFVRFFHQSIFTF